MNTPKQAPGTIKKLTLEDLENVVGGAAGATDGIEIEVEPVPKFTGATAAKAVGKG